MSYKNTANHAGSSQQCVHKIQQALPLCFYSFFQTLRGEKAALQQALDAAHQQLDAQADQLRQLLAGGQEESSAATAAHKADGNGELGNPAPGREPEIGGVAGPGPEPVPHASVQQRQTAVLQQLVSELQSKLAEYRSYLQENQEEIERLQVRRVRPGHGVHGAARGPEMGVWEKGMQVPFCGWPSQGVGNGGLGCELWYMRPVGADVG